MRLIGSVAFILGVSMLLANGEPVDPGKYDHAVKVACVGDSITQGIGSSKEGPTSWPADLGRMLDSHWSIGNFGASGRTLLNKGDHPYQTQGHLPEALAFNPDVVIIMLGTNDTKPQNWSHKDEFVHDYQDLIDKFKNLPTHPKIFLCYPPAVFGERSDGINEPCIVQEMPMIREVATGGESTVIDVHSATKEHPEFFPDFCHPNDKGAELIARAVYKSLVGKAFEGDVPPPP